MWSVEADWALLREAAIELERPHALIVIVLLAALIAIRGLWSGPHRIGIPGEAAAAPRPRCDLPFALSLVLRCAALTLLGAALAGPVGLVRETPAGGEGVDIVIALDASGSMNALDAGLEGRRVTRLDLAKRVVADFVRQRRGDRIGLVVFGAEAFTQSPLTVDRPLLLDAIDRTEVGVAGDATALGEAIGLGVRRLRVPGAPADGHRVILLITDGRHNAGTLGPETAARVAATSGVRVHAIGIGTTGSVPFARSGPGEALRFERVDLDAETLRSVSTITGGQFFHARRPEDLAAVAAAIDRLEARPRPSSPRYRRVSLVPLALLLAIGVLFLECATTSGLVRRLP
jgi:Ca-activated chloride channel family protein